VETFGARNTHWIEATIDPRNPNLFSFEPRFVLGNEPWRVQLSGAACAADSSAA
jgi:hypothetical protein